MITTKEFKEFLEEDERQILALKNANLFLKFIRLYFEITTL